MGMGVVVDELSSREMYLRLPLLGVSCNARWKSLNSQLSSTTYQYIIHHSSKWLAGSLLYAFIALPKFGITGVLNNYSWLGTRISLLFIPFTFSLPAALSRTETPDLRGKTRAKSSWSWMITRMVFLPHLFLLYLHLIPNRDKGGKPPSYA